MHNNNSLAQKTAPKGTDYIDVKVKHVEIDNKEKIAHLLLEIETDNQWHIYWHNPGDTGTPTLLQGNSNIEVLDFVLPIPQRGNEDDIGYYAHYGTNLAYAKFKLKGLQHSFKFVALICKDICLPVEIEIPFRERMYTKYGINVNSHPDMLKENPFQATANIANNALEIEFVSDTEHKVSDVFLITNGIVNNVALPEISDLGSGKTACKFRLDEFYDDTINEIGMYIVTNYNDKQYFSILKNIELLQK